MQMLMEPVCGPAVWKSTEMSQETSWIYRLNASDLTEIETALESVRQRGLGPGEFGREAFPLPTLGERLSGCMDELENGRGFVVIRGVPIQGRDLETVQTIYWGLGQYWGEPVVQNLAGDRIARIEDLGYDVTQPNVKPSQTNAQQNPHSDPADAVALLCIRPAMTGGTSRIASAMTIYNEILANHPEYLECLYRGFHHDLRGDEGKKSGRGVSEQQIPVYCFYQDRLSTVFNVDTIRNAQPKMGVGLPQVELDAIAYIVELASRPNIRLDMQFQPGDIQLLNNYTILHCRTAFSDHLAPDKKRLLFRLWLHVPTWQPVAPAVAQGYVTGARTGFKSLAR